MSREMEVLEALSFDGIDYRICRNSLGAMTAYVRIPEGHPWNERVDRTEMVFGRELHTGYNDVPLDVHGGLTFSERIPEGEERPQEFTPGAWVGWDYGHAGDCIPGLPGLDDGHFWTQGEVKEHVLDAIQQVLAAFMESLKEGNGHEPDAG